MEGLCSDADSCKTRSVGMYPLAGAGTLICAGGHLLGIAGSSVGRVRTLSLSVAVSCLDPGAVNCWLVVKECIAYMRYKLCALDPWTGCRGSCWWRELLSCISSTICLRLIVTGHVVSDVCMSESRYSRLANGTVLLEAQHLDWTEEAIGSLVLKCSIERALPDLRGMKQCSYVVFMEYPEVILTLEQEG